jgi:fimbrial chaperone protein
MRILKRTFLLWGLFLLYCCSSVVWSANLGVAPVRIFMGPKDRAIAITLTNNGDSDIALQADIYTWNQNSEGKDVLDLSDDLILSPPIFKLAPHTSQTVRLALLMPMDLSRQMTYRLIVTAVPEAIAAPSANFEVPMGLALSLPIFITPPLAKRELNCALLRDDEMLVTAHCDNSGTAYAQIREMTLLIKDEVQANMKTPSYLLPGAKKPYLLKSEKTIPTGAATLRIVYDAGKDEDLQLTIP